MATSEPHVLAHMRVEIEVRVGSEFRAVAVIAAEPHTAPAVWRGHWRASTSDACHDAGAALDYFARKLER